MPDLPPNEYDRLAVAYGLSFTSDEIGEVIVVTDLTRFQNQNIFCLAGFNPEDGECIRPTPYLQSDHCLQQNILPGARLTGHFLPKASAAPHLEDRYCPDFKKNGSCSYNEFYSILAKTRSPSLCAGFGVNLEADQKYFKHDHSPQKSIITLEVDPHDITILNDQYNPGRLKSNFTDMAGNEFRYISVTDYSFSEFAEKEWTDVFAIQDLNDFLMSQKKIMLRIGLTRIRTGMDKYRSALLCAEKDPITCHRTILICRNLKDDNIRIYHIIDSVKVEAHEECENRLIKNFKLDQGKLFEGHRDLVADAYRMQADKIAYVAETAAEYIVENGEG